MMRPARVLLLILLAATSLSLAPPAHPTGGLVSAYLPLLPYDGNLFVFYRDFEIVPAQIEIAAGQEVTFVIQGGWHQPYNFTPPNVFEAPAGLTNNTWSYTFDEVGTLTILCGYHANMSATVIVTEGP